ncbi:MAG: hypothetical protein CR217_00630 [Beijerinckiaceae bacterium]|nr:MAG: hypothetical protein CR217_00630 [Beijerinckiaceae bacterium]
MSFLLRQVASDRLNFSRSVTFLPFELGNARAQHGRERQNSDKSPGPTLLNGDRSKRCANRTKHCALALLAGKHDEPA